MMARPLRLEFPGALFHVMARGNRKQDIFHDDRDRELFLELLGECVRRFCWILTAYALMPNHFHLVVELTLEKTLSRGMQWLNGKYAQAFNWRHDSVGHLYQGRFKAPLIEKENYFLQVLRYVVLNPVKAGIVARPEDYVWSSHRAVLGQVPAPDWLAVDDVLIQFATKRDVARASYQSFVNAGIGVEDHLWEKLVGNMYLGSDEWTKKVREQIDLKPRSDDHPRMQRVVGSPTMGAIVAAVADSLCYDENLVRQERGGTARMIAAWIGWHEALLTNQEIAAGLRLRSSGYVSRMVRRCDEQLSRNPRLRDGVDLCLATLRRAKYESKL